MQLKKGDETTGPSKEKVVSYSKRLLQFAKDKTTAYWFGRPGYFSVDIARIFLGIMWIIVIQRNGLMLGENYLDLKNPDSFQPIGILHLLFDDGVPPSGLLCFWISQIGYYSAITLCIGLFSRVSNWVNLLTMLFLCAMPYSFSPDWSHGLNVCLLAHIAFVFAPVGQTLSIDALLRKVFKITRKLKNGFWAVLCANWAVGLMFFNAFFYKIFASGGPSLQWAASENMRNKLITRYTYLGEDFPNDWVEWVANNEWVYKSLAYGNLLFQALPFVAVFFVKKPVLRFCLGLFFIVEEVGLGTLMGLNDFHWYFLIVFFIDFDYFIEKWKIAKIPANLKFGRFRRFNFIYASLFIGVYFFLAFPGLRFFSNTNVFEIRAYPFSEFKMYSDLLIAEDGVPPKKVLTKYDVETNGDLGIPKDYLERKMWRNFTASYVYNDSTMMRAHLENIFTLIDTKTIGYLGDENLKLLNPEAIVSISMGNAYFVYPLPGEPPSFNSTDYVFKSKLNRDGEYIFVPGISSE